MNKPKEKAREEIKEILRILPSVNNKELRSHLLKEKQNLESIIALHELREKEAREVSQALKEGRMKTRYETRIVRNIEQR